MIQRANAPWPQFGALSLDQFMRRHWQRQPLCVRQAFAKDQAPFRMQDVLDLARSGNAQARLVRRVREQWQVSNGPHERLPALRTPGWTVLVNGVDRHLDAAHSLLRSFRFLPDARIDDLMVSVASDGGGVGPHLDSYDVFLLQVQGQRRWRIAPPGHWRWVPNAPLKLIADFQATQEWVLEAGDMLYLPPGWAHEGTAIGPCMTCSVGARAPSRHEFLAALLSDLADDPAGKNPRHQDRGRAPTQHPAELPEDLVARLNAWAHTWRPSTAAIDQFIGRWLTEPAADVWFDAPSRSMPQARFMREAVRKGIALDRGTRMAWRGGQIFINGEALRADPKERPLLKRLADDRSLSAAALSGLPTDSLLWPRLHQWAVQGWLHA